MTDDGRRDESQQSPSREREESACIPEPLAGANGPVEWRSFAQSSIEAHVEGGGAAALDPAIAAPLELLDSSEIIELSIKPSLWFIPIVSARVVAIAIAFAALALVAAKISGSATTAHTYAIGIALAAAVGRLVLATVQWASRLYLLTNRRVLRFSGVFSVDVSECPLTRIGQTYIKLAFYSRPLYVGTIRMNAIDARLPNVSWDHVSRPGPVYEKLVRAIRRAQSGE